MFSDASSFTRPAPAGATVNSRSTFDRKHYFYHDLPHGFQVTQQSSPIVLGGAVEVRFASHGIVVVSLP